jgi:hypothetical protein
MAFIAHYRDYPSHYVIHPGYVIEHGKRGGYDVYRKHVHDYRPTSQITGFSHAARRIYECECGKKDVR